MPGQVDLFKRSNSITLGSQFGPLLFCDIAISPQCSEQYLEVQIIKAAGVPLRYAEQTYSRQ